MLFKCNIYGKNIKIKRIRYESKLFRMDWIESFNLLNQPINSLCDCFSVNSNGAEKILKSINEKIS